MKGLLATLLLLASCAVMLQAQTPPLPADRISRVYNQEGWKIPGLANARVLAGAAHATHETNGVVYQTTVLIPSRKTMSHVPHVWLDAANHRYSYEELSVRVERITAFEVNAQPYCYKVEATMYLRDPRLKTSGWGGVLDLWYYDETGEGQWTIMDTNGPLLPRIPLPPSWAGKRDNR